MIGGLVILMQKNSLAICVCLLILTGCGQWNAETPYEQAYEQFALGNWHASIDACNRLLELSPDNPDAFLLRGRAALGNGSVDEAIQDFSRVIELLPEDAEGYHHRAIAYGQQQETELAMADRARARELDDLLATAYPFDPAGFVPPSQLDLTVEDAEDPSDDFDSSELVVSQDSAESSIASSLDNEEEASDAFVDAHKPGRGLQRSNTVLNQGGPANGPPVSALPTVEFPQLPIADLADGQVSNEEIQSRETGDVPATPESMSDASPKNTSIVLDFPPPDNLESPPGMVDPNDGLNPPDAGGPSLSTAMPLGPNGPLNYPPVLPAPTTGISGERYLLNDHANSPIHPPNFPGNPIFDPSLGKPSLSTARPFSEYATWPLGLAPASTQSFVRPPAAALPTRSLTTALPYQPRSNGVGTGLPGGGIGRANLPSQSPAELGASTGLQDTVAPPPTGIRSRSR